MPYPRVVGTHIGAPAHVLVGRNGTVYIEPGRASDPLRATLGVARACEHVTSISFDRVGWRPGVPFVQAAAHFDGELQQPCEVPAAGEPVAGGLDEGVTGLIFDAGLAAASALSRTTDDYVRTQLSYIVEILDHALAELRSAIFKVASGDLDSPRLVSAKYEEVGDVHRVILDGELDMMSAAEVEARLVARAGSTVEVDLSSLTFVDARGIAALVSAKRRIAAGGDYLRIVGAHGIVRRVFTLVDLDDILDD